MQMLRAENVIQVEIFYGHIVHGAGIRENVAFFALRKNDAEGRGLAAKLAHLGKIHATFAQALKTNFAKRIAPDGGTETDFIPQQRQVMGEYGRRAAQSDAQVLGNVFALELELLRKPIKD